MCVEMARYSIIDFVFVIEVLQIFGTESLDLRRIKVSYCQYFSHQVSAPTKN